MGIKKNKKENSQPPRITEYGIKTRFCVVKPRNELTVEDYKQLAWMQNKKVHNDESRNN